MTTSLLSVYLISALVIFLYASAVFFIAEKRNRYDLADVAWGGGLIIAAAMSFFIRSDEVYNPGLQILVTSLVVLWGGRLVWHTFGRLIKGQGEDRRYQELRVSWLENVKFKAYTRIFLLQGALALVIVSPVLFVNAATTGKIGWLAIIGVIIWLIGFVCEIISDVQLKQFLNKEENKGQLMTEGLWKYSRHPNYFGELVQWWGIYIITLSVPYGWLSIFGPLALTYLIVRVSGVPALESKYAGRAGWEDYKARTSVLIPQLPRKVLVPIVDVESSTVSQPELKTDDSSKEI